MDGQGALLSQFRAALAAFDDDALAALANKGLVRRARKDLETTQPNWLEPAGGRPRLELGDGVVTLALPAAQSTCTCPAVGVCRHILAALIFVRESAIEGSEPADSASAEPPPSAAEEVMAINDEALANWAGKTLVTRAAKALGLGLPAEFEEAGALVTRFPTRNITCRWMPGGGLAGMVCSCHEPGPCEHKVAAVLAFQAHRGARDLAAEAPQALEAATGAPRTREEVFSSLGEVLRDLVTLGTSRLSRATAERLRTLAVSAHGVDLPRLERLVRALADEVELGLTRNAQADSTRLLSAASRVEALRQALARPTPALVGAHKSSYNLVGDIELVGLGARRWRTRSGYTGLTVTFWDRSARAWASWSESRPLTTGGFDPAARYDAEGPWLGLSPSQASRSTLRLMGAWRNRHGRLSGRPSTRALATGPAELSDIPAAAKWPELLDRVRRLFGGGFGDRDERDEIVLLAPAAWGPAAFDPVRQELVRFVFDADGRPLPLVIPHTPENEDAIGALERLDPVEVRTVLGLLRLDADRLAVEPIAVHTAKKVINLTLDGATHTTLRSTSVIETDEDVEEPDDEDELPAGHSATPLGQLLDRMAATLESIGDGGFAAFRGIHELRELGARADAVGLSVCARAIERVASDLEGQRRGEEIDDAQAARHLLRAYYVVGLCSTHDAIATATAMLALPGPS